MYLVPWNWILVGDVLIHLEVSWPRFILDGRRFDGGALTLDVQRGKLLQTFFFSS
jgi:hypothetical protein